MTKSLNNSLFYIQVDCNAQFTGMSCAIQSFVCKNCMTFCKQIHLKIKLQTKIPTRHLVRNLF